jgi:hypothetical protein
MSDGMEDGLMDDEIRDALAMTREELLARAAKGEPADVASSAPRRGDATPSRPGVITMNSDVTSIVIQQGRFQKGHFEDRRPVKVKRPSVTIL